MLAKEYFFKKACNFNTTSLNKNYIIGVFL